jgi:micrococcal nuclease
MTRGPLVRGPLVLFALLAGCAPPDAPPPPAARPPRAPRSIESKAAATERRLEVTVQKVVDGDTLRVTGLPAGTALVRLTGIDAPEIGDGRTIRECYGPEARRWLTERAPAGTRVTLVLDVGERDRFGRLLAYVYRDGAFLNAELVENGYARTMSIRPNLRHAKELKALERAARSGNRGLWGSWRDQRP